MKSRPLAQRRDLVAFFGALFFAGLFFLVVFRAPDLLAAAFFPAGFFAGALLPPLRVELAPFFVGSFFRFVLASSSSCFSLIDFAICFEAPFSVDFDFPPRFAESAAPAAICCFLDLAGIRNIRDR